MSQVTFLVFLVQNESFVLFAAICVIAHINSSNKPPETAQRSLLDML